MLVVLAWVSGMPAIVVGLAILTSIFRARRSASVDDANLLKY